MEEYGETEQRIAILRAALRDISQSNLIDQDRLIQLREALASESDVSDVQVSVLFSEIESLMPGAIRRRLSEVTSFHRSVVANRKIALSQAIDETTRLLYERNLQASYLDDERARLLSLLEDAGALSDFMFLQQQLGELSQKLTQARSQFQTAQMLEGGTSKLEFERKDIEIRIRSDHAARSSKLEHAALIVRQLVRSLYDDRAGNLVIDVGNNGPTFKIEIEGDRSEGIARMEIWCFDMLLIRLCSERGIGPRFLIHDSHVFDGVDERQITAALNIGAEYAKKFDFQYIVTMNSDVFEGLNADSQVKGAILDRRLTDDREDGGLFGTIVVDLKKMKTKEQDGMEQTELEFAP